SRWSVSPTRLENGWPYHQLWLPTISVRWPRQAARNRAATAAVGRSGVGIESGSRVRGNGSTSRGPDERRVRGADVLDGTGAAAGRPVGRGAAEGVEQLVDAEGLEQHVPQAVLPGLD